MHGLLGWDRKATARNGFDRDFNPISRGPRKATATRKQSNVILSKLRKPLNISNLDGTSRCHDDMLVSLLALADPNAFVPARQGLRTTQQIRNAIMH